MVRERERRREGSEKRRREGARERDASERVECRAATVLVSWLAGWRWASSRDAH